MIKSSPLRWYGGKGRYWAAIRKYLPEHTNWVDCFGGSGVCTLAKDPAPGYEVYNDINSRVTEFWSVVKKYPLALQARLRAIGLPSEAVFKGTVNATYLDPIESAARYYIRQRASYNGETNRVENPCYGLSGKWITGKQKSYWSHIDRIPLYSARFERVLVTNECFSTAIPRYDNADTLYYFDPPYNQDMRSGRALRAYGHEMTDEKHTQLLTMIRELKGSVVLSGYWRNFKDHKVNNLYLDYLREWTVITIPTISRAAGWNRDSKVIKYREETIWLNERAYSLFRKAA